MRYRWFVPLCAAPVLALAACSGAGRPDPGPNPDNDPAFRAYGRAIVVSGSELGGASTNLISVLRNRIVGMQVNYASMCPAVVLRSRKSMFGDNSPIVYVDGARASNTCVLEELAPADVLRMEVYPQGITPRGGYESHANGLILIFMRSGEG